jgi:ATP-dependent DNA helicase RecQ
VRLLAYFDEASTPCGNCDVCLDPPQVWDGTVAAQKALSCVYRTGRFRRCASDRRVAGQRDGARAAVGHGAVSTFGIGKELMKTSGARCSAS